MRVAIILLDGVDEFAVAGVQRAIAAADLADWSVEAVAEEALVTCAGGLRLVPHRLGWGFLKEADVLVLCGGVGVPEKAARDGLLVAALRAHLSTPSATRLLASVGSGALVLARAGLLAGRRATAGREDRDALARDVEEIPLGQRVVQDGRVVTSTGPAAGVELGLHVLARLASPEAALRASEVLEVRGWVPLP